MAPELRAIRDQREFMATADINEYFDQATDRAIDLREQVKDASAEIEDLVEQAEKTDDRLADETGRVTAAIDGLVERLGQAEEAIASARREAATALDGVDQRSAQVREGARQLVTRVQEGLQALTEQQEALTESIQTRMSEAGSKLASAAEAAGEVAEAVSQGHEQTREALGEFEQTLRTAGALVEQTGNDTVEALASAVTEMATAADGWTEAMGELLTEQTTALLAAANGVIVDHNASMARAKARLGDEVEKGAGEPVRELVTAIQELRDVADSHEAALTEEARAIAARIGGALPQIQQLAQWFRDSARLS
jgi:chromosome segregation ATPase